MGPHRLGVLLDTWCAPSRCAATGVPLPRCCRQESCPHMLSQQPTAAQFSAQYCHDNAPPSDDEGNHGGDAPEEIAVADAAEKVAENQLVRGVGRAP